MDTSNDKAPAPPCVDKASDVEGNAFYCPTADVMAWDRSALLPVLKERFGEAAVMLVLAHEMGHAVQRRAGLSLEKQQAEPDKYPTILIEAQADCYAGSFVRWVVDDNATYLNVADDRLDPALESLITFRDPIGTEQTDEGAHGDAFDRVSAFQDGYDNGAKHVQRDERGQPHVHPDRVHRPDRRGEQGGNLKFDLMLETIGPHLNDYFNTLVTKRGQAVGPARSSPPPTSTRTARRPTRARSRSARTPRRSTTTPRSSCPRSTSRSATTPPARCSRAASRSPRSPT